MIPLAQKGYFVVAPDQRRFGQTTLRRYSASNAIPLPSGYGHGKMIKFYDDLTPFGPLNVAAYRLSSPCFGLYLRCWYYWS